MVVRSYRSAIGGDRRTDDGEDESDGVLPKNSLKRSIWADNLSDGGPNIGLVVEQYSEVERCQYRTANLSHNKYGHLHPNSSKTASVISTPSSHIFMF